MNSAEIAMENTYWNHNGRYQEAYDRLEKLMPFSGPADTVAGEMIRAMCRLGYDFYNNGMCNNTSGALNYLWHHRVIDIVTHQTMYCYSCGVAYRGNYNGDNLHRTVESMCDQVLSYIIAHPELETLPNTEDIFDYEDESMTLEDVMYDEDEPYDEEEDDDQRYVNADGEEVYSERTV